MDCPTCGTSNPPQARFCLSCGTALDAATTALREERKVVSVLFADLVGFTARAEQLDPEDVERILRPYHDRLRRDLERHGGTVEKFIGDAVMAVFGAPIAHEDDAERAVRAALAIRDWAREQPDLELRIAVNSGETLVSIGARAELGQSLVKGDVVNTAARLQAAAPINGVLVGESTYRATDKAISYRSAPPVAAKGKAQAVPVWEALEARSRFGVDVEQASRAPLVGRQRELAALLDALARVRGNREPQLVTLVGVPGIGKSRLLWELFQRLDALHEFFTWRQGRSLPYGAGVSYWALGEIVKAQAGIRESDTPAAATAKLEASVADVLGEGGQQAWIVGHLRPLVGLGASAEVAAERSEAFAAWRRYLEALAEKGPLVLVFEDLQWADDGMLEFVDHLVDWASGVPLLVVATARPELLMRSPNWGGGKSNALTLSVTPLSEADTAQLVHALFERSLLPAETQQALLERAGGNPLYAEEFVRMAREGGLQARLPESVQAIIAARIDALATDEKRLLQQAAVLGKVFWLGGLADVAGRADRWQVEGTLHGLERREFIRRERHSSVDGEDEFVFRHALVRDVAYEQLPRAERAELHQRAASWIESLGRVEDAAEMLAHHYLAALEYARASGQPDQQLVEPARRSLRAAGERAVGLNAFAAASRFYAAAVELTGEADPERPALLFGYARSLAEIGDQRGQAALQAASAALAAAGDLEQAAEAEVIAAEHAWYASDRDSTNRHLARAEELIAGVGATPSRARVLTEISRYHMLADRPAEAIAVGRQAIALARQFGLPAVEAHALDNVGTTRFVHGDLDGWQDLERSLALARAADSPEAARTLNNMSVAAMLRGEISRSYELRGEAVTTERRYGRTAIARFGDSFQISTLFMLGEWDRFVELARGFLLESERLGPHYADIYLFGCRSMVHLARANDAEALRDIHESADRARKLRESQVLVPSLFSLCYVEEATGHPAVTREVLSELLGVARNPYIQDAVPLALAASRLGVTELVRQVVPPDAPPSNWIDAFAAILDGDLQTAAELIGEIGHKPYEALVRTELAAELAAAGRHAQADAQARRALEFWRSVGATRYVGRAENLLSKAG